MGNSCGNWPSCWPFAKAHAKPKRCTTHPCTRTEHNKQECACKPYRTCSLLFIVFQTAQPSDSDVVPCRSSVFAVKVPNAARTSCMLQHAAPRNRILRNAESSTVPSHCTYKPACAMDGTSAYNYAMTKIPPRQNTHACAYALGTN
jgi:hypothetical protein